jgi:serine/threonine-protein kinase
MIGRTIGKYRFVAPLGRGGMGTVFRAVDETLDREVAIKVLNPDLADSEIMKRFRAEATTLARLNHPEIATIYELYRSDCELLMVMEFVRGETLDALLERWGPLAPEEAAYIVDRVLGALGHAHRAGIVHRDLKPANVMVSDHGGVKIMDFGIARVVGAEHVTMDRFMIGTPAYMPPEQVLGQDVDGRADLYSIGIVFYRLLTGMLPFEADSAFAMAQKQISDTPLPLHLHREGLPDWCEIIVKRALAKSPADRFQTAEEFRAELNRGTGTVTTEHLTAFRVENIEPATPRSIGTPQGAMIPAPPATARAAMAPPAATGTSRSSAVRPADRRPRTPSDGATVLLRERYFVRAGSLLRAAAMGVSVLAILALGRPAPATPTTAEPIPAPEAIVARASPARVERPAPTASKAAVRSAESPSLAVVGSQNARRPSAAKAHRDQRATAVAPAKQSTAAADGPPSAASVERTSAGAPMPPVPMPPLMFDAKALVGDGEQQREHDAKLLLANGMLTVTANNKTVLQSVPYGRLLSVNYSHGRNPLWNSPAGPTPVMRVQGGKFGFLKGDRHWIVLRTKDLFIVLRVYDVQVNRMLEALEARSGRKAELIVERKDIK